ncbi:DUF3604 domain-containing protein [Myxococcota bacterium]|nr:DUF3604 domain-containing protein [Myxococcota bacterium]
MNRHLLFLGLLALACQPAPAPSPVQVSSPDVGRVACDDYRELRNAYFGELHIHTSWSADAYAFDVRTGPDDAYRFARGEPLELYGGRTAQLERPLDFAAVTEHASQMGELALCTDPSSPVFSSPRCVAYRGEGTGEEGVMGKMGSRLSALMDRGIGKSSRSAELCGDDFALCQDRMQTQWERLAASAERYYDRSESCSFTTFNGYEYTATPSFAKVHRNVIFRNEFIPKQPIAWVDEPNVWNLWERLREECLDADTGCDVITIPHNSNMSNGLMFELDYGVESPERQAELAALRARIETLIEVMQTKGDSECRNGLWQVEGGRDPYCDWEKWRRLEPAPEDCEDGTGSGGVMGQGCQSRSDFARYALVDGLREAKRLGVNPIKFGMSASTDNHNSNAGDTEETSYQGLLGWQDAEPATRIVESQPTLAVANFNPGGLVGVWAEQNTRDAIFDAMKRRETFGTSGTRIRPRFFGGWDMPSDLCQRPDWLSVAEGSGVTMGSDLTARPRTASSPVFVSAALRDPGAPGLTSWPLERIQVIKAWAGEGDVTHQRVVDVAVADDGGADSLCGVWEDPDFDPQKHAVYYSRVLEVPSPRWSTIECDGLEPAQRPAACDHPDLQKKTRERAWTSPIWYVANTHP